MYQTWIVNSDLSRSLLGTYSDLPSAQAALAILDQSQVYSITYADPILASIAVIQ